VARRDRAGPRRLEARQARGGLLRHRDRPPRVRRRQERHAEQEAHARPAGGSDGRPVAHPRHGDEGRLQEGAVVRHRRRAQLRRRGRGLRLLRDRVCADRPGRAPARQALSTAPERPRPGWGEPGRGHEPSEEEEDCIPCGRTRSTLLEAISSCWRVGAQTGFSNRPDGSPATSPSIATVRPLSTVRTTRARSSRPTYGLIA
jgi:hypothetical protein